MIKTMDRKKCKFLPTRRYDKQQRQIVINDATDECGCHQGLELTINAESRLNQPTICTGEDEGDNLQLERYGDFVQSHPDQMCLNRNRPVKDYNYKYPFSYIEGVAIAASICFFLFDVVSDVILAEEYYNHGRMWECAATSFFIIFPAILTSLISMVWFCQDKDKCKHFCTAGWICNIVFTILPTAPIVRNIKYVYHGVKSRRLHRGDKKQYHYEEMLYEDRDASMLRMFDAFLESAPQLTLQVYLAFSEDDQDKDIHLRVIRAVAMFASWIGVSWSVTSYYKALRVALANPNDDFVEGSNSRVIGYFLWRAFEIGPRIVALALFASIHTYYVFIFGVAHWVLMLFWLIYQRVEFYQKPRDNTIFIIAIGFTQVFAFINVGPSPTRFRAFVYYFVFYLENFAFLATFYFYRLTFPEWTLRVAFTVIPSGFLLHFISQTSYYLLCHPKKSVIKVCIKE